MGYSFFHCPGGVPQQRHHRSVFQCRALPATPLLALWGKSKGNLISEGINRWCQPLWIGIGHVYRIWGGTRSPALEDPVTCGKLPSPLLWRGNHRQLNLDVASPLREWLLWSQPPHFLWNPEGASGSLLCSLDPCITHYWTRRNDLLWMTLWQMRSCWEGAA